MTFRSVISCSFTFVAGIDLARKSERETATEKRKRRTTNFRNKHRCFEMRPLDPRR